MKAETAEKVTENWEQLKMKEKDGNKMVLSGVPSALPSLIKAYRIQDKARNVGFDWEERSQVWTKVKEEIGEFEAEVENMAKEKAEAEFGDVMFSLINAARLYKINPDNALELTNQEHAVYCRREPRSPCSYQGQPSNCSRFPQVSPGC